MERRIPVRHEHRNMNLTGGGVVSHCEWQGLDWGGGGGRGSP